MADKKLHCGRFSYRKTTLAIGIIQLVLLIVQTILEITGVFKSTKAIATNEDEQTVNTRLIVNICISLFAMGITILLIIGALKRNRCLLMPWLIVTWIGNVLVSIFFVISLFYLSSITALIITIMLVRCAFIVFTFYCLVVVTKYYRVMKKARNVNTPSDEPLGAPLTG